MTLPEHERPGQDQSTTHEHGPIDKTAMLAKPINSLLNSEATAEVDPTGDLVRRAFDVDDDQSFKEALRDAVDLDASLADIERRAAVAAAQAELNAEWDRVLPRTEPVSGEEVWNAEGQFWEAITEVQERARHVISDHPTRTVCGLPVGDPVIHTHRWELAEPDIGLNLVTALYNCVADGYCSIGSKTVGYTKTEWDEMRANKRPLITIATDTPLVAVLLDRPQLLAFDTWLGAVAMDRFPLTDEEIAQVHVQGFYGTAAKDSPRAQVDWFRRNGRSEC